MVRPRQIGVSSLKMGPFYTVASVELGNTTTKCVLMTTNLETAEIYHVAKEVRMTRTVRAPKQEEAVFGSTIVGVKLTQESVSELVSDIITTVVNSARINLVDDLHFAVRSTGVTAGFAKPDEVGQMVKALADGCLSAGIPPRKMTASISPDQLSPSLQEFSWLRKVHFDGAVASSLPPASTDVVANEMEGELVTAGIKGAAKSTKVDFRNPVMTLDFGTTLAGRITDDSHPYGRTVGSFVGLAGAIPDALVMGAQLADEVSGSVLDVDTFRAKFVKVEDSLVDEIHSHIRVELVPENVDRFGTVPVNPKAASESAVALIGVDCGVNGTGLSEIRRLGRAVFEDGELNLLLSAIDLIQTRITQRIVDVAADEGLILPNTALGLTGRAITTGQKPRLLNESLCIGGRRWSDERQLLFVEDGLAIGAAVAARCMNSLGTRHNPMGGRQGDGCVMGARMKLQNKERRSE
ncbi:MAG: methanogenesis marker 14 protein [Candidatus Hodarchaeota archaeon]